VTWILLPSVPFENVNIVFTKNSDLDIVTKCAISLNWFIHTRKQISGFLVIWLVQPKSKYHISHGLSWRILHSSREVHSINIVLVEVLVLTNFDLAYSGHLFIFTFISIMLKLLTIMASYSWFVKSLATWLTGILILTSTENICITTTGSISRKTFSSASMVKSPRSSYMDYRWFCCKCIFQWCMWFV